MAEIRGMAWVVVVSRPSMEVEAKWRLEEQARRGVFGDGFEVYLPLRLFENRKGEMCSRAFLPNYLFARVPLEVTQWRELFGTRGVKGVLGVSGARSWGVADKFVQGIKAHEEGGYIKLGLLDDGPTPHFEEGQRVRLSNGLEGMFMEKVDARRGLILLSIFQRDSPYRVDLKALTAVLSDDTVHPEDAEALRGPVRQPSQATPSSAARPRERRSRRA